MKLLFSTYSWLGYLLIGAVYVVAMIPLVVFDLVTGHRNTYPYLKGNALFFGSWIGSLFFVKTSVDGLDRLMEIQENEVRLIIVCNHQSLLDMAFIIPHITPFFSLAKPSFRKIPFMNVFMGFSGNIFLKENDPVSLKVALEQTVMRIKNGETFFVFPEGTRKGGPALNKFKDGAFRVAVESGATILPLCVSGTSDFVQNRSIILTKKPPQHFKLMVGRPVEFSEYGDDVSLANRLCKRQIEAMLKSA